MIEKLLPDLMPIQPPKEVEIEFYLKSMAVPLVNFTHKYGSGLEFITVLCASQDMYASSAI